MLFGISLIRPLTSFLGPSLMVSCSWMTVLMCSLMPTQNLKKKRQLLSMVCTSKIKFWTNIVNQELGECTVVSENETKIIGKPYIFSLSKEFKMVIFPFFFIPGKYKIRFFISYSGRIRMFHNNALDKPNKWIMLIYLILTACLMVEVCLLKSSNS